MVLDQFFSTLVEISNSVGGKPSVRIEVELIGREHQLVVRFDWRKENLRTQRVFKVGEIRSAKRDLLYEFAREVDYKYARRGVGEGS